MILLNERSQEISDSLVEEITMQKIEHTYEQVFQANVIEVCLKEVSTE